MIGSDILTLFPASQTLLGKQVSELAGDDLAVHADGSVTGTFYFVTGYTGFSDQPDEQSGYYFPFHLEKAGTSMTFLKNGVPVKEEIPFDPDVIFRVTQEDTFEVRVDGARVVTFTFRGASFAPQPGSRSRAKK